MTAPPRLRSRIAAYSMAHAVGVAAPLLTVPWVARALGPDLWGRILVAQALAGMLTLVIEFGFDLTAARDVARLRAAADARGLTSLVAGVLGGRALLVPIAFLATAVAVLVIPALAASPVLGWQALTLAIARGFSPLWFFQGEERPVAALSLDASLRAAGALAVFPLVRGPEDVGRPLALQAGCALVVTVILLGRLRAELRRRGLHIQGFRAAAVPQLRAAADVFLFRATSTVYQHANPLLVSLLATPSATAAYASAERLVRAATNTFHPFSQAFLPGNSQAPGPALDVSRRRTAGWLVGLGVLWSLLFWWGGPLLIDIVLGTGYASAGPVLRALAPLPFVIAIGTFLGLHWAIPTGRARAFLRIVVSAALAHLAMTLVCVPRWGASGMAMSTLVAELMVAGLLGVLACRPERSR